MGKKIKELCEWVEGIGYSSHGWIGGDWHIPLHLLSKLMATDLEQRRQAADIDIDSDVTLKISFDSLLELAEDNLGVPVLITERDLLTRFPNIHLALVTYLVCLRTTIDHLDAKQIRNSKAPRLVYEAKNGRDSSLPACPECNEHVFIIERVIVERVVYHRQCLKCTECGKLLSRGAFKKTKHGFECISHAVRKILDAHENSYSSSGSGTYDRYGYGGKSPRPAVAPPPRPKPLPPPKPACLTSARPEPCYETLDEIQSSVSKSVNSPKPEEVVETAIQENVVVDKIPETKSTNPFDDEEEEKKEEKDVSDSTSTKSNQGSESAATDDNSSGDSVDSGVVLRMAKMFGEVEGATRERSRASQPPIVSTTPVAPPRPKRTSMLITSAGRSHSPSPVSTLTRPPVKAPAPTPKPRLNLEDYPGYLCPFGEEEETRSESPDYPSGKNPFADSDDEASTVPPVPAPRSLPPPIPVLPGTSDRPKVQPPPPPPGAQVEDPATPPPKPPRGLCSDARIHTLRISRKKYRAPLPPVPQMRKINFTEHNDKQDPAVIANRLKEIEEQMTRIEMEGRSVEKEMLFQIETNPRTWQKGQRTDDWVEILTKKLDLMREQLYLLGRWRENYLNEVHSETEYYIRCLLEKEKIEKSEWEIERETTLTNLLIYIIDEKLKLDEYMMDLHGGDLDPRKDDSTKAKQKKHKLKKRVQMLSKRLKSKKTKEPKEPKTETEL